jgi:AmmeMemoRadiSam system protein B
MSDAAARRAAFAGRWYPGSADELGGLVDRYLEAAQSPPVGACAVVAPHAGLAYSGAVAAHAYATARAAAPAVVVLVGPSHYAAFPGVATSGSTTFETPLGPLPVETALCARLAAATPLVSVRTGIHAREHSLELQLPFLARVLPRTPIVPILMGQQDRSTVDALSSVLVALVDGLDALVVASSDLSHFHDRRTASALDRIVLDRIDALDPDGLMDALEDDPHHACGGGPIVTAMRVALARGANAGRVLRYADSGDVSGDTEQVVGYVSAAFGRLGDARA